MNRHDLKSTLQLFMEQIWNSGNFDEVHTYVCEQYIVKHDPGDAWEGQTLNHATFIERVCYSRHAFPDLRFDIKEMVAEGERVAAFWIMSGTHEGDLQNLMATGKPFRISGMTIYEFDEDGKICGHTQAYDRLGFITQMGVLET